MPAGFLPAFCPYECGTPFPIEDPANDLQGGRRANRNLATLVRWVANSYVLEIPHYCPRKKVPVLLQTNCAAVTALMGLISNEQHKLRREPLDRVLGEWAAEAEQLGQLLNSVARRGRTLAARHIRNAETIIAAHSRSFELARAVLAGRSPARERRAKMIAILSDCEHGLYLARDYMLGPVLEKMRLPKILYTALIEPQEMTLEGIAEREVVYVARIGTPPFRAIAAQRLAGGVSSQALATLQQLLFDPDLTTALVALDSICIKEPDSLKHILQTNYDALGDNDSSSAATVRSAIGFRLTELPPN